MTLSAVEPDRDSYLLWQRFSMPTKHGPRDAVTVPSSVGDQVNLAYSFLLQLIVLQVWAIIVLIGVLISLKIGGREHNSNVVNAGIWNAQGSPFSVFKLAVTYFTKMKRQRGWLLLIWAFLALAILVAGYAIPIKVAPLIILSNAAPVNPSAIYVPSNDLDTSSIFRRYALEVPAVLRAAGTARVANVGTLAKVSVDHPEILKDLGDGEKIMRMGYRYNITGLDFGLQHYPDLMLHVEGSCMTDYGWHKNSGFIKNSTHVADEYIWFGEGLIGSQSVSLDDSPAPIAYFQLGDFSPSGTNITWGAIVSSVNRSSYSPGTDPWYLTGPPGDYLLPIDVPYNVLPGRPALSCWENNIWSYRGHNSTVGGLNQTALPGLNMSPALQSIFARYLTFPMIVHVALRLGASTLLSSASALDEIFDAGSSSLHDDLHRWAVAAYISSVNILTDTTLYPADKYNIPDGIPQKDRSGIGDFVIWSSNVTTLSVRYLIVFPVITLTLLLLVASLTQLPSPWYRLQALQATVLYSCLHEEAGGRPYNYERMNSMWKRHGDTPVFEGNVEQVNITPKYDKHRRTLSWELEKQPEG
jgi:hypothetical protein